MFGARSFAGYAIEIEWWKELGQLNTWFSMLYYSIAPVAAATLLAFAALWICPCARPQVRRHAARRAPPLRATLHARAAGPRLVRRRRRDRQLDGGPLRRLARPARRHHGLARRGVQPAALLLSVRSAVLLAAARLCSGGGDPLHPGLLGGGARLAIALQDAGPARRAANSIPAIFRLEGGLESRFLRGAAVVLLLAFALKFYLGRYEMVYNEHGTFLVGIDYVDQNIGLPLQWLVIFACIAAAGVRLDGPLVPRRPRWRWPWWWISPLPGWSAPSMCGPTRSRSSGLTSRAHIHATRSAFGIEQQFKEVEFKAHPEAPIDAAAHKPILDNVRLWDTRAFHDTVTQIQALRPYYVFADTDVDRYTIDGQYRQTLLTPRELDLRQLPAARANWINPAFIYTHGYGVVLAPVSQITPDGLPVLLIENAPPEVKTKSLKLTRPELYYGEVTHEPVFVHTSREEFNYPSGEANVSSRYEGKGGFPGLELRHAPGRRHQRRRAQHPADQLPHRQQPHDDPPQGDATA